MAEGSKDPLTKPFLFVLTIIVVVLLLAKLVDRLTISTDKESLSAAHSSIEKCQICHQPSKEVRPINCARLGCHPASDFRKKVGDKNSALAQHLQNKDCLDCHTEHKGKNARIVLPFEHDSIPSQKRCSECHIVPKIHPETGGDDCGECHQENKFSEMTVPK